MTHRVAMRVALNEAELLFGPVDAIVNNAGMMLLGEMAHQAPAEWDAVLDVNVKGLPNGIHAVLDGIVARKHGTIIDVSSVAGRKTFPSHGACCIREIVLAATRQPA